MHLLRSLLLPAAILLGSTLATPAAPPPPLSPAVDELYAGELSDVGPQYLLVPAAARPARVAVWARTDLTETDNATFTETAPRSSTVLSLLAGVDGRLHTGALAGGSLALDAGAHTQLFRYGLLGGDNKIIDFLQVDRNNFDLGAAHVRATWQRGAWLADASLQGSVLRNRSVGRIFYREAAGTVALHRQWKFAGGSTLLLGGELARRWSWTETYGLLPASWNNRAEFALSGQWSRPLRAGLVWRTTARTHLADYAHPDRHRRDVTGTLGTELGWAVHERLELRLFVSHERRDSTEPGIPDYARWEGGTGVGARWTF